METRDDLEMIKDGDLTIGPYVVRFDATGATIEHERTHMCYRVNALTATNTVDLVCNHRQMILAMVEDRPGDLTAYRIEEQREDEH